MRTSGIVVTTGNQIEGHRIQAYLGVVRGIVVRAPTIGQGFSAGLASFFGGNIGAFEELCDQAREQAFDRMVEHAGQLEADGIIAMRFDATEFAQNTTEVLAYGTAVKLAPLN